MNNTICTAPYVGVFIGAGGHVRTCVASTAKQASETLYEKPLVDLFNCDEFKQDRVIMKTGAEPDMCKSCVVHKDNEGYCGLGYYNRQHPEIHSEFLEDGTCVTPKLEVMWIAVSGECTYACRTCIPRNSSQLSAEWKESGLLEDKDIVEGLEESITPELLSYIAEHGQHLKVLTLTGGDPTRSKQLIPLLETLASVNTDLELNIHMNGYSLRSNGQSYTDLLKPFKNLKLLWSLDSFGPYNDYIRKNSKYSHIWKVFDILHKELPDAKSDIVVTVSNLNAHNFGLMIKDVIENRPNFTGQFLTSVVYHPIKFRPTMFTRRLRRSAVGHCGDVWAYLQTRNQSSSVVQSAIKLTDSFYTALLEATTLDAARAVDPRVELAITDKYFNIDFNANNLFVKVEM